jgi:hypothetical protein
VEVIVSYVELKKGVRDAFSAKHCSRGEKAAALFEVGCRFVDF